MSHTDKTTNYNLPLFADDDTPTWLGDWNQGMNAVDAALNDMKNTVSDSGNQVANLTTRVEKVEADSKGYGDGISANAGRIASVKTTADSALSLAKTNEQDISLAELRIAKNEQDLGKLPAQIANAQQTAESASSEATAARRSADTVAAKFPIRTSSIQSGAVTADKLDETAVHRLLASFTFRRFDSTDESADNAGMVCPAQYVLKGWYVEELALLIVSTLTKEGAFQSVISESIVVLPSYVPRPNSNYQISSCALLDYNNSATIRDWSGMTVTPTGAIGPNSILGNVGTNPHVTLFSTVVGVMKGGSFTAASADAYKAANGLVR